jgi:hypothetical protein
MKVTKGGNFKPVRLPEPQTALARCYSVVDIGTVPNIYNGKINPKNPKTRKINITFEFPTLLGVFNEERGEEPFVIGLELTASTGEQSNLSKLISQWRNKPLTPQEQEGFDPTKMVGKTAYISFLHKRKPKFVGATISEVTNENTNLKFNGIMPKPKDINAPSNINEYIIWDWDLVEHDGFSAHIETFEKIPLWLRRKIGESEEFKRLSKGYKVEDDNTQADEAAEDTQPEDTSNKKTVSDDW